MFLGWFTKPGFSIYTKRDNGFDPDGFAKTHAVGPRSGLGRQDLLEVKDVF